MGTGTASVGQSTQFCIAIAMHAATLLPTPPLLLSPAAAAAHCCPASCCYPQALRAPVRSARLAAPRAAAAEVASTVSQEVVDKCVNAIRFLAIDAVNKAKSGHPGLPMGAAPMSYVLFNETMNFNPKNPAWFNRDRFVLSAGHGSMLQYALMHLVGYDSVSVSAPAPLHAAHSIARHSRTCTAWEGRQDRQGSPAPAQEGHTALHTCSLARADSAGDLGMC